MSSPITQITTTPGFYEWLAVEDVSLAFSTYRMGKLFLLGRGREGRIAVNERTFNRCMGLWSDTQSLWVASGYQVWRMENMLSDGVLEDGADRLFVPQTAHTTGDIDIHDIVVDGNKELNFVSTLFCCVAKIDERYSFRPTWRPSFLTRIVPEDRCHLNGLGCMSGTPKFATVCGETDENHGWRSHKLSGGCIIDIESNAFVARQLSMPHSPRYHAGRLWALNSGLGQLVSVDPEAASHEPIAFCQGFARGLAFTGKYAVVGLSKPRDATFKGLKLDEELAHRQLRPYCGVSVVDLERGVEVHRVTIEGKVDELYDVITLPGVRCPRALGLKTDDIQHNVWFVDDGNPVRFTAQGS